LKQGERAKILGKKKERESYEIWWCVCQRLRILWWRFRVVSADPFAIR